MQLESAVPSAQGRQFTAQPANAAEKAKDSGFWGDDGFSFGDIIDAINPLQHLPVIGTAYRAMTHDDLSHGSRMVGGTLFGGPIGFVISLINNAMESDTGKDIGDHILTLFTGDEGKEEVQTANLAKPELNESTVKNITVAENNDAVLQPSQTTLMVRKEQEVLESWLAARSEVSNSVPTQITITPEESRHDDRIMHPLAEFANEYRARQWVNTAEESLHTDLRV